MFRYFLRHGYLWDELLTFADIATFHDVQSIKLFLQYTVRSRFLRIFSFSFLSQFSPPTNFFIVVFSIFHSLFPHFLRTQQPGARLLPRTYFILLLSIFPVDPDTSEVHKDKFKQNTRDYYLYQVLSTFNVYVTMFSDNAAHTIFSKGKVEGFLSFPSARNQHARVAWSTFKSCVRVCQCP